MLVQSLGNTNKVNNTFKYQIPYAFKYQILQLAQNYLPKMAIRVLFGIWGTLYGIFSYFVHKMYFLLLLLSFFLFQIKTCVFHLKEEGKELLGMVMAALANNNGYYVLYLFPLSFSNSQLLFSKLIGISQRC